MSWFRAVSWSTSTCSRGLSTKPLMVQAVNVDGGPKGQGHTRHFPTAAADHTGSSFWHLHFPGTTRVLIPPDSKKPSVPGSLHQGLLGAPEELLCGSKPGHLSWLSSLITAPGLWSSCNSLLWAAAGHLPLQFSRSTTPGHPSVQELAHTSV